MDIYKKSLSLLTYASIVLLASCSSTPEKTQATIECVYPDSPTTSAPTWICEQPVPGFDISAVGSSEKSAAGYNFMKQMATTAARVSLAQRMRLRVQNLIKQYVETTGAASSETVDKVNSSITSTITDESLIGSYAAKTINSPTGTLYVLVAIDPEAAKKIAENALQTSMNNENALWQQFKAEQGQAELARAIANQ